MTDPVLISLWPATVLVAGPSQHESSLVESSPRLKPGDSALFGDCATMHGGIATA